MNRLPVFVLALALFCGPANAQQPPSDALRADMEAARKKVYPALVNISVVMRYFTGGRAQRTPGGGSGVIVTPEGHVLTNYHVAGHTTRIKCTLTTGEGIEATVVAHDPLTDLSVLKLRTETRANPKDPLPYATLGNSDLLQVGDYVMAMGNPLMLSSSVTLGIVANPKRVFTDFLGSEIRDVRLDAGEPTGTLTRWIQHDALILPGNSGGPLVNLRGEVVGINELGGDGFGFAIPSRIASQVLQQALANGQVRRGWLGMHFEPVDKLGRKTGALVASIAPGSPAEKAGVQPGDILETIDDTPTDARFFEEVPLINQRVAELQAGQTARLKVLRSGKESVLSASVAPMEKLVGEEDEIRDMGLTAQEITPDMARVRRFPNTQGMMVTGLRPGYPFEGAQPRLDEGDVILTVDGAAVDSLAALRKALGVPGKKQFLLTTRRGQQVLVSVVKVPDETPEAQDTELPKAWLGVTTQVLTPDIAQALAMGSAKGFRVTQVYPWTEASSAGLKVGDVITSLNGTALTASRAQDADDLRRQIEDLSVGEKAALTVLRDGKPTKLSVLLEEAPAGGEKAKKARQKEFEFGVRDVTMLDRMQNRWSKQQSGAIVSDVTPGGWANMAGLHADDLILSINEQPVTGVGDFQKVMDAIMKARPHTVTIFVRRGVQTQFVFIEPVWSKVPGAQ